MNIATNRVQIATVTSPSFERYNILYEEYQSNLECTCSQIAIRHSAILSVSPSLHSVCSSDFVTDDWIRALFFSHDAVHPEDWLPAAASQFRCLSNLCNLTKSTVDEMVYQLNLQKIITFNLLSENEFYQKLNDTINQMIQSTEIHYRVLINTLKSLIHADQPLVASNSFTSTRSINTRLKIVSENEYNDGTVPMVSWRLINLSLTV